MKTRGVIISLLFISYFMASSVNATTVVEPTCPPEGLNYVYCDLTHEVSEDYLDNIDELRLQIIDGASDSNTEFHRFLDKYYISETVWWYKGSELHLGNDYVAKKGAGIHAPISGYIIMEDHSITRTGWLGCTDGEILDGGGNQLYMIGEVDNKIYGLIFMHCQDIYVSVGEWVEQDEIIATVGKTGNADASHVHLEMFYLGDGNLSEYVDLEYAADFGVGRDEVGYSHRCEATNYTAPCLLDSRDYIY